MIAEPTTSSGQTVPTDADRPAIPIVIGVVGHRDIRAADVGALESALERVLREFQQAYKNTPIVVMTSLAQGADTLAARVADRLKLAIRAPLPMPADEYRASTSFDTDKDRAEFDRWMGNSTVERFQVPMPPAAGDPPGGWAQVAQGQGDPRKTYRYQAYANAGAYLVLHCHVLVAFWDGQDADPKRPSGTAEHVLMKSLGRPHGRLPKSEDEPLGYRSERGPVIILKTPRMKSDSSAQPSSDAGKREVRVPITILSKEKVLASPEAEVYSLGDVALAGRLSGHRFVKRVWTSLGSPFAHRPHDPGSMARREVHQFRDICQAIDDFNRDAAAIAKDRWKKRMANVAAATKWFKGEPFAGWAQRISAIREATAELANPLSKRLDIIQKLLFPVVGLSLLFFHLYAHPIDLSFRNTTDHPSWLLALSLAMIAFTMVGVVRIWLGRLDVRRFDYRVLAEAFRVRLVWSQAGIGRSVASSYPGQLRSEVAWVRQALRLVCPPPPFWKMWFDGLTKQQQFDCLTEVKDEWVRAQKAFHIDRHEAEHRWLPWCRGGGFGLALAGWFGLLVLLLQEPSHPPNLALVGCSMLVVAGGLLVAFCERRAHEDLSKQYERMTFVFDNGLRELEERLSRQDVGGAQSVIEALGREAVAENASWVILRRSRPLELHIGG